MSFIDEWVRIIDLLKAYRGAGFILPLYAAAFLWLFATEKDKRIRTIFLYAPAVLALLFMLPPVSALYRRIDGDTYYRVLWLFPMGITLAAAAVRMLRVYAGWSVGAFILIIALCGRFTYADPNVLPSTNRLHLPEAAIHLSDFLLQDAETAYETDSLKAAFPSELVQFVRQYSARVHMPFGREMTTPQWDYYDPVYEVMEKPETICMADLTDALKAEGCPYLVLRADRAVDESPEAYGFGLIGVLDGFLVYRYGP